MPLLAAALESFGLISTFRAQPQPQTNRRRELGGGRQRLGRSARTRRELARRAFRPDGSLSLALKSGGGCHVEPGDSRLLTIHDDFLAKDPRSNCWAIRRQWY